MAKIFSRCEKPHSARVRLGASSSLSSKARDGFEPEFRRTFVMNTIVPQQHSDTKFPYVLVISTLGTIISLGGILISSMPVAPIV